MRSMDLMRHLSSWKNMNLLEDLWRLKNYMFSKNTPLFPPENTTQTVIYNENVEWTGTSDVPSINFAYATNPYIGSLSTYIPSAPNDSYISWHLLYPTQLP